jgi:outer membrane immunogenic protein
MTRSRRAAAKPSVMTAASLVVFGTFRGRLGYLITPQWLLYGTGGALFGSAFYSAEDSSPKGSDTVYKFGWTAGGGVEYALTNMISLKAEYLHIDFMKPHFNLGDPGFNTDLAITGDVVRFGVNAHFN